MDLLFFGSLHFLSFRSFEYQEGLHMLSTQTLITLLVAAVSYSGSSIVGAAPVSHKSAATTDTVSYSRRALRLIDTHPDPTLEACPVEAVTCTHHTQNLATRADAIPTTVFSGYYSEGWVNDLRRRFKKNRKNGPMDEVSAIFFLHDIYLSLTTLVNTRDVLRHRSSTRAYFRADASCYG